MSSGKAAPPQQPQCKALAGGTGMKSCPQSPGLGSEEGSSTETNPKIPTHIEILPLPEESTSSNAAQPENRAQEHPHAMGGRRILQDFWAVWNPELPLSPSVAPLLGPFVPCWACFQSQIPWETWSYRTQENSRGTPLRFPAADVVKSLPGVSASLWHW